MVKDITWDRVPKSPHRTPLGKALKLQPRMSSSAETAEDLSLVNAELREQIAKMDREVQQLRDLVAAAASQNTRVDTAESPSSGSATVPAAEHEAQAAAVAAVSGEAAGTASVPILAAAPAEEAAQAESSDEAPLSNTAMDLQAVRQAAGEAWAAQAAAQAAFQGVVDVEAEDMLAAPVEAPLSQKKLDAMMPEGGYSQARVGDDSLDADYDEALQASLTEEDVQRALKAREVHEMAIAISASKETAAAQGIEVVEPNPESRCSDGSDGRGWQSK
ncbi:unnamed protein product, partial [Prorocentrum cordatum]